MAWRRWIWGRDRVSPSNGDGILTLIVWTDNHKPLRELGMLAFAVTSTVERRLERGNRCEGKMWLPWEGDFKDVPSLERLPVTEYLRHASRVCEQFEA